MHKLKQFNSPTCKIIQAINVSSQARVKDLPKKVYTPRRAMLYVPGDDEKKLGKIELLSADCVVMDCEDGVALNRKREARNMVKKMVDDLNFKNAEKAVRINSVGSGLAEEDLNVIFAAKSIPSCIMVPKVDTTGDIDWLTERLANLMKIRQNRGDSVKQPKLGIFVESARSLLDLDKICDHCERSSEDLFSLDVIVFGSDDYCADIGAERTADATELLYARQRIVAVAKAHRLQAIDLVHINYKDVDSLLVQSLEGKRMGFTGKQVIHPSQIDVVQRAFSPSDQQIEWAKGLIQSFSIHQESGKGAFTYEGAMIDRPLLLQAQNILALSNLKI